MTGDRRNDDDMEHGEDLLADDEFVLDFGDHEVVEALAGGAMPLELAEPDEVRSSGITDPSEVEPFEFVGDDGEGFDLEISDEVEFFDEPSEPFVVVDAAEPGQGREAADLGLDELLFEDEREIVADRSAFGAELGDSFGETSGFELPDEAVTADDLHVRPFDLVDDELEPGRGIELHDLDDEADAWDGVEDPPSVSELSPQQAGGFRVLGPADEIAAHDDEWGVGDEAAEIDPIYGDAMAEEGEFVAAGEPESGAIGDTDYDDEVDYSEYEEAYADGTGPVGPSYEVRGGVAAGSRWKLVAGLAALLPIAAVAGIAFWTPQWFGGSASEDPSTQAVLVDRIRVERPTVELVAMLPDVAFRAPTEAPSVPDLPLDGQQPGSRVAIPAPDSIAISDDTATTEPGPLAVSPENAPGAGAVPVEDRPPADFVQAGDNLLIARFAPDRVSRAPAIAGDLSPGRQAFAQLHNGSYFTGTVRRIDASMITLALPVGEVALRYDELRVLTALEDADLSEVTSTQRGFVRLRNQQRLVGAILRSPENERVTLMGDGSVIDVPNWQIEAVGYEPVQGLDILDDEDDDWLRRRVRSRLNNR